MRHVSSTILLILSGAIALAIGLIVVFAPHILFAGNANVLGAGAELYSEIRAPGGLLVMLGGFILASGFSPALRQSGLILSATLYLSYGLARIWSLLVDGHPGDALLLAMSIELVLGMAALWALAFAETERRPGGARS